MKWNHSAFVLTPQRRVRRNEDLSSEVVLTLNVKTKSGFNQAPTKGRLIKMKELML